MKLSGARIVSVPLKLMRVKKIFKKHLRRAKAKKLHKHPFVVPVVTFLLLFFITAVVLITLNSQTVQPSDSRIVELAIEGKHQTLPTRAATVGELLQRLNITLNEGDVVEPSAETEIVEDNFKVNVYRARNVIVIDGPRRVITSTAAKTPRSIAEVAGFKPFAEDRVVASPADDFLTDKVLGEKVEIVHAAPVFVNLYGTPLTLRTHAKTVQGLIDEKDIQLEAGDVVQPAAETKLTANTQVFITRAGVQIVAVEETVPSPTEIIQDKSLSFGTTVVRQKGVAGKKVKTYEIESKDGKEIGRRLIQEVVVVAPVKQIVARGAAVSITGDKESLMNAAGIAHSDHAYVNYIVSRESRWNTYARNSSSGAYGLCQSLPGSKMASAGADWETNPVTQLKWCNGYAKSRYGSWAAAYDFWLDRHYW